MSHPFKKQLNNIRPKSLTSEERARLWSSIEPNLSMKHNAKLSPLSKFSFFSVSYKYAVAIALVIAFGASAGVVSASNSARPGDLLFPVDVAAERVRIALASNKNKDALELKFAEERFEEARAAFLVSGSLDDEEHDQATSTEGEGVQTNGSLNIAIAHLEKARDRLESRGNNSGAVLVINDIIAELALLAGEHAQDFDNIFVTADDTEFEVRALGNSGKIKIEGTNNRGNASFKFKKEFNEDEDDVEIENEGGEIKVKIKSRGKKSEENGDDENDDEHTGSHKVVLCHFPPGDPDESHTIKVGGKAARAHLAHGDNLGECGAGDDDGGEDDTTPPVISNINSSAATTSATVSWTTDEDADSTVYFGTVTPLEVSSTTNVVTSATPATNHSLELTGLTADTTYFFIVTSTDGNGNIATSSEQTFTTLSDVVVDTTPPVISNLTATSIASTSATVAWDTDENATSKVWYDTVTPLTISSTTDMVSSATLASSHSLDLSGLTASTTYYYLAVSEDAEGNIATSSEQTFDTTN